MNRISFFVPSVPVAQPRQRQRVIKQKDGKVFATNYTPAKHPVQQFKAVIQMALREVYDGPPWDCPIGMTILFVMPRPSSKTWKTKAMPREWYSAKKNDWDNLGKAVCDALNGLLYQDDGLICSVTVKRVIASGDEQPSCYVEAFKLPPYEDADYEERHEQTTDSSQSQTESKDRDTLWRST